MYPPLIHLKHLSENARTRSQARPGYRGSRKGSPRRQMSESSFFQSTRRQSASFSFAVDLGPLHPSHPLASFYIRVHARPCAAQNAFGFVSKLYPSHSIGFVFTFPFIRVHSRPKTLLASYRDSTQATPLASFLHSPFIASICGPKRFSPRYLPKGFGTLNPPPKNIVIEVTRCI